MVSSKEFEWGKLNNWGTAEIVYLIASKSNSFIDHFLMFLSFFRCICVLLNLNELSRSLKTCNMYLSFRLTDIPVLRVSACFSLHMHCISLFFKWARRAERIMTFVIVSYLLHLPADEMSSCLGRKFIYNLVCLLWEVWFGFSEVHVAWYWSVCRIFLQSLLLRLHAILFLFLSLLEIFFGCFYHCIMMCEQ